MRKASAALATLALGSIVSALTPDVAAAQYLDPGAGSIIVQAVIAIVIGAGATVKLYWHRIAPFLQRRKDRRES